MEAVDNYIEKTDQELVKMSLQDQDNFAYLIKRYEKKLLAYIKRISGVSEEEASDILQDVFLKIYLNLNDFDPSLKFSSWIFRITHNEVINNFRKKKARPEYLNIEENRDFLENLSSGLNLNQEVDLNILKNQIAQVLARLDAKYREVLILKFWEEKDYREISDILAKPLGTVATLINRAKKSFREEFKKLNSSPSLSKKQ